MVLAPLFDSDAYERVARLGVPGSVRHEAYRAGATPDELEAAWRRDVDMAAYTSARRLAVPHPMVMAMCDAGVDVWEIVDALRCGATRRQAEVAVFAREVVAAWLATVEAAGGGCGPALVGAWRRGRVDLRPTADR